MALEFDPMVLLEREKPLAATMVIDVLDAKTSPLASVTRPLPVQV
jgi:phosphoribosyl-dephospho-CoA transferase